MPTDVPEERAGSRAGAPEEADESTCDLHGAAEEILHDSEKRLAEVSQADAPADAADEHRRSEETAG
jgi:hypothetical protein